MVVEGGRIGRSNITTDRTKKLTFNVWNDLADVGRSVLFACRRVHGGDQRQMKSTATYYIRCNNFSFQDVYTIDSYIYGCCLVPHNKFKQNSGPQARSKSFCITQKFNRGRDDECCFSFSNCWTHLKEGTYPEVPAAHV